MQLLTVLKNRMNSRTSTQIHLAGRRLRAVRCRLARWYGPANGGRVSAGAGQLDAAGGPPYRLPVGGPPSCRASDFAARSAALVTARVTQAGAAASSCSSMTGGRDRAGPVPAGPGAPYRRGPAGPSAGRGDRAAGRYGVAAGYCAAGGYGAGARAGQGGAGRPPGRPAAGRAGVAGSVGAG